MEAHIKVFRYITAYRRNFLKCILTYCNNYNVINIGHSDVQKYLSYTGLHKRFDIL